MKFSGRGISLSAILSIGILAFLGHVYGNQVDVKIFGIIGAAVYFVLCWLLGSQYDKARKYSKRLEKSKEDMQNIIDNLDAIIWSTEATTGEISVSEGIEKIFGYDREAFRKNRDIWRSAIHPDDMEEIGNAIECVRKGKKAKLEFRLRKSDGSTAWTHTIITPSYDDHEELAKLNGISIDITDRKNMEDALVEAESKYRSLVEGALIGVYIFQNDSLIYVNPSFEKMFGYKMEEIINSDILEHIYPRDREKISRNIERMSVSPGTITENIKVYNRSGQELDVKINAIGTIYNGEKAIIGTILDVTEEKRAIEALRKNENLLEDVFDSIRDGIVVIDKDFNIVRSNKAMEDMYRDEQGLTGKKCYSVSTNKRSVKCEDCPASKAMETREPQTLMFDFIDGEGKKQWRELQSYPLIDDDGRVLGVIEQMKDITEKKKVEDRINQMAFHDSLTGLPNRYKMKLHLKRALIDARKTGASGGVMFIDLDRFKMINDTMGHSYGDMLLRQVSRRMKDCLRKTDTVSRYGGDEFVIHLEDASREFTEQCAARILEEMSKPFEVGGHEVFITPSIGICLYPEDGGDEETLIKNADAAMYLAKEKGKNNYRFYSSILNKKIQRKLELETGLRRALENNEFVLHYQPQINLKTGKVVGTEALIRWKHPELGIVSPAEFIPVAEETGLIVPIGKWVMETACRQNKIWQEMGMNPLKVAVNISARQFQGKDFIGTVKDILNRTGLKPECLEIEITEGIMLNIDELITTLEEFKSLGIQISIDDFGTGYSSLGILKHLPIDVLKIDKSFVSEITSSEKISSLVKTIIDMSFSLNFEIIAEGIETEEQAEFLSRNRCNTGQGYLFSYPLPAEEVTEFMEKNKF